MLSELTFRQYQGWIKWMRKFHPYPDRDDVHYGLLISTIANQWSEHPVRAIDCMPYRDPYEEDLTVEQMAERLGLCLS